MSICKARFRETVTPLMRSCLLMSGKEMRFQVSPKTFRLDGWIVQRIRQWVPKPSGWFQNEYADNVTAERMNIVGDSMWYRNACNQLVLGLRLGPKSSLDLVTKCCM